MDNETDRQLVQLVTTLAERELYAFTEAVTQRYGGAHAAVAADDWIHEFVNTPHIPATEALMRQISKATAARLSSRVLLPGLDKHSY